MSSQGTAENLDPDSGETLVALVLVTVEDFRSVDLTAPIAGLDRVDCHAFERAYQQASESARTASRAIESNAYRLLASLCSLHFKVEDRAGVFGPQLVMSGRRTAIPDDFRGEQNHALEKIIPDLANPGLRARIADVVWTNDRRAGAAARAAVDAYCEAVEGLGNGRYRDRFENQPQASVEEIDLIHRALQIVGQISKKGQIPDRVGDNLTRLYELARHAVESIPFERIGRLRLYYGLISATELATDAEALAQVSAEQPKTDPLAIKKVWDLAAEAREKSGDAAASRRCRLNGVDQTLAMRNMVQGASAAASWIRTAISELRHIPDTREQRENLRRELRQLQEAAQDDYGTFSTPLDLSGMQAGAIEVFSGLTLPEILKQFALIVRPRTMEELRKEAIESLKNAPLRDMFSAIYADDEGKVVAETPGAQMSGEPSEAWLKGAISRNQPIWRHIVVGGSIEPARQTTMSKHPLTERHFQVIATHSPFIPVTHRYTFALGFARFMQGDFVSAAHLLIPQVEHCVRHVLRSVNLDSSKIMPDMLQEDRPLSALLEQHRQEMDRIFTADLTNEIDLLFNHRPGPALRHEFAHGKIGSGYCFDPDVIYACWFIYHLCCLPLLRYWKDHIAPAIEAECF